MPTPVRNLTITSDVLRFQVKADPVFNVLYSMMLILRVEELSGLNDWIGATAKALPEKILEDHAVVMFGLHYAIIPKQSFESFNEYLEYLETADPELLRDRLLDKYMQFPPREDVEESSREYSRKDILSDVETFLDFLRSRFDEKNFIEQVERSAFELLNDPTAMQKFIVDDLRMLWTDFFEAEFKLREPLISETVQAFSEINFNEMSDEEAVRFVTGRWNDKLCDFLEERDRIIFVPSPHLGPHSGPLLSEDTLWMMFNCRLPEGAPRSASQLSRAELLVWLSALADDTRLQILALLREQGELCAQEIISRLETSQSTASRHLRQLSASGFIREQRKEAGKCYRLNPDRFEEAVKALQSFVV
jgi:DNA-binding transcriptional ArsR family regulator